jgi:hypothetical protein
MQALLDMTEETLKRANYGEGLPDLAPERVRRRA